MNGFLPLPLRRPWPGRPEGRILWIATNSRHGLGTLKSRLTSFRPFALCLRFRPRNHSRHQQRSECGGTYCTQMLGWRSIRLRSPALTMAYTPSGSPFGSVMSEAVMPGYYIKPVGVIRLPDELWLRRVFGSEYLPIRPIWTGLISDTIIYSAVWWLLLSIPFALRSVLRRKRGLCLKCAYDLQGAEHEVCPECGTETGGFRRA